MLLTFAGDNDCSLLSTSGGVTWNTGTNTLTIVPITGIYLGCTLTLEDHGSNLSNTLILPDFVHGM